MTAIIMWLFESPFVHADCLVMAAACLALGTAVARGSDASQPRWCGGHHKTSRMQQVQSASTYLECSMIEWKEFDDT